MRLPRQDGSRRHVFESMSSGCKDWESSGAGHVRLMSEWMSSPRRPSMRRQKRMEGHDRNGNSKIKARCKKVWHSQIGYLTTNPISTPDDKHPLIPGL